MSEGIRNGGQPGGPQSHSAGSAEDQHADSPDQPKSRSGPEFLGLSRCAACYNQQAHHRWGGDGESSSSAEDSGPEVDCESEAESSSSSSRSEKALSETLREPETEKPSSECGDAAAPEPGGKDGDGGEETEKSREDTSRTNGVTRRAPLIKSFSLPASFTPHLAPLSLLPRPQRVVSTLHLQVLTPKHHADDVFYIAERHVFEREEEKSAGGGRGRINYPPPPQAEFPWQQRSRPTSQQHQLSYQHQQEPHQLSQQHQQQQPQPFPPLSAQGQRLPPPLHPFPVLPPPTLHPPLQALNAPHLHALTPQPCWLCYSMHFPYAPYWSHYSSGQFPR